MEQCRFAHHLFNITGISVALLSLSGELTEYYCNDKDRYQKQFFEDGGVLQFVGEMKQKDLLIKDILENVWVTLIKTSENKICVLGPAAFSNNEHQKKEITQFEYRHYAEIVLMTYEFFSGKAMSVSELLENYLSDSEKRLGWQSNTVTNILKTQEYKRPHHNRSYEECVLNAIRQGNQEEFIRSYDEPMGGYRGILAKNKVRSSRNLGIASITLFTRAAMDGGVGSEQALTMSDAMINQIELLDKWEDVYMFCRQCGVRFANLVAKRQSKNQMQAHLLADRCENLIFARIHDRITVKELAQELSVNPDYLSRLFHESVGVTIGDYIQREKVNLAKHMLIYSQYPLEDIAAYLGFSTQSHFGRIFKKQTGMTPGQYRKQYTTRNFLENPQSSIAVD